MNRHAHPTTPLRTIYDRVWRRQAPPRHRVDPVLPWGWLHARQSYLQQIRIDLPPEPTPIPETFQGGVFIEGVGFMSHSAARLYHNSHYGIDYPR